MPPTRTERTLVVEISWLLTSWRKRRKYVKVSVEQLALRFSLPTTMARMGRSEDRRWQVASSGDEYWLAWYWLASRLVPQNDRITILFLYYWYHFVSTLVGLVLNRKTTSCLVFAHDAITYFWLVSFHSKSTSTDIAGDPTEECVPPGEPVWDVAFSLEKNSCYW